VTGPVEEELWLRDELDDVFQLMPSIERARGAHRPANPALNKIGQAPEEPQLLVAPG
jgi:hypothetical protein